MRGEILMNFHRVSGLYDLMQPSYDQITVLYVLAKNVIHFPGPKSDFDCFYNVFGGPGNSPPDPLLFTTFPRKRCQPPRTDPGYPTPGSRMTVVKTNSLKIITIIIII